MGAGRGAAECPDVPVGPRPAAPAERIGSLDLLRGVAVLGILVMNIQAFSMPDAACFNPTAYGDLSGLNLVVWFVSHLLVENKFMALFSMLFGAGIVLLAERLERRGVRPAGIHYRRIGWLLLFGLVHAYLLWFGDILVWYALSGFIAYLFRRLPAGWLLFFGAALLAIGAGIYGFFGWSMAWWPEASIAEAGTWWAPGSGYIQEQLSVYRGGWLAQVRTRALEVLVQHTFVYGIWGFWRTLGLMLAGMALYKWGILSAARSRRFYLVTAALGLLAGYPVVAYGAWRNFAAGWSVEYSMFTGTLFNYIASYAVAIGYVALVMLWWQSGAAPRLRGWLVRTGRMAFTSYILQTLICTTLFYGYGLGLYGRVPRWGQLLVVFAVWALVVAFAVLWLDRFRYGPLEWLWRRLTYGRRGVRGARDGSARSATEMELPA